jgi:hypothetical protein
MRAFSTGVLAVGLFTGLTVGCFRPPSGAVLFACEPDGDDACPEDYSCEADACCHKDGSDVDDHFGECAITGAEGTGLPTGTDDGTTSGTGGSSTGEPGTTGGTTTGTTTGTTAG